MENKNQNIEQLSSWNILTTFINKFASGTCIKRKELLNLFEAGDNFLKPETSTIDTYRRVLTVLGYLDETGIKGVYKVLKHIPNDLTSTNAKELSSKQLILLAFTKYIFIESIKTNISIPINDVKNNTLVEFRTNKFGNVTIDCIEQLDSLCTSEELRKLYDICKRKYSAMEQTLYSVDQIVRMMLAGRLPEHTTFTCTSEELLSHHISSTTNQSVIWSSLLVIKCSATNDLYLAESHKYMDKDKTKGTLACSLPGLVPYQDLPVKAKYCTCKIYTKIR